MNFQFDPMAELFGLGISAAIILILPVGAFVLRKQRRNARGFAKFALNALTALAILTTPLQLMLALMFVFDLLGSLSDIAELIGTDTGEVFAAMLAFAVFLTTVRLLRGRDKLATLRLTRQ